MYKYLTLIILLLSFPIYADATDCTQEMLNKYNSAVNQVKVTPKQLGDSSTYEIWATKVPVNLALERGRTALNDGEFLGYANADENVVIRVYVADGSSCAGKTIKNMNVLMPKVEVQNPPPNSTTTNPQTKPTTTEEKNTTKKATTKKSETTTKKNNENNIEKPEEKTEVPIVNQKEQNQPTEENKGLLDDSNGSKENNNSNNKIYIVSSIIVILSALVYIIISLIKRKKLKSV